MRQRRRFREGRGTRVICHVSVDNVKIPGSSLFLLPLSPSCTGMEFRQAGVIYGATLGPAE